MYNDIMAAGSRERPPMLATERYAQWQSCFMRYIDTRPNTTATEEAVHVHTITETYKYTTPEKRAYFDVEAEAIHLILTGTGDDIYFTFDACTIAKEMRIAIERLQQGESLNKQDVKTTYFWEFGKFTSRDGESIESYYSRHKGKEIAKPITPPFESTSEEDSDPEQAQRDKQLQKNLALEEKGVPLNVDQGDWLDDTNEESDEQELEAHSFYMAKIQEVPYVESGPTFDTTPLEKVHTDDAYNVFANDQEHIDQPENMNDTYLMEKVDSNTTPYSSDVCNNDFEDDQNTDDQEDERVALANLIANLKLDIDENKKIQKQLKRANVSLTHELNECKSALAESNDIRDRCISALHNQEIELEKYKKYKDFQIEKEELERKLKASLDRLAQQKLQTVEALKTQAYETFQYKEKNAELVHQSSLEHIRYDRLRKEIEQLQKDFKIREDKDINKVIALESQIKFLNERVYKTNKSVQTIHMLAHNPSSSYNGRPTFANPKYLKTSI
ncbi:hypothetical protein Tco_0494677 [Tanacetum coccineum]